MVHYEYRKGADDIERLIQWYDPEDLSDVVFSGESTADLFARLCRERGLTPDGKKIESET
jgi:hypothetical protein